MKNVKALIFCMTLIFATAILHAAPYDGEIFTLKQGDGSDVDVKVYGDEFYQDVESIDGYTLIRGTDGVIYYSDLNTDQTEYVATNIVYTGNALRDGITSLNLSKGLRITNAAIKAKRNEAIRQFYPDDASFNEFKYGTPDRADVAGDIKGLTILIDFSDKVADLDKSKLEDFLNLKGYSEYGNNGSIRDYYADVSLNKVDYTNVVYGYYRANKPKSYYDSNEQAGPKAQELIKEALNAMKGQGFNFAQLSTNSSNQIIALNVMYAGKPDHGWSKGLWPHQYYVSGFSANGVSANKYQITNIGTELSISTFCHENGHMVCNYPDLYDYGRDGVTSSGLGYYCLMTYQVDKTNPVPPNPYYREIVGWETVTDITDAPLGSTFTHKANTNTSYVYRNKSNSRERFYIDSRYKAGRNADMPGQGLLIFHVDENGDNENQQMTSSSHFMVSLEQADGNNDLEKDRTFGNKGEPEDWFYKGYKDQFNDNTVPNARWWNGSNSNLDIRVISEKGGDMTFSLGEVVTTPTPTATPTATPTITPTPMPTNVALNRPVVASGEFSKDFPKEAAVDGDPATVWGSAYNKGPQWIFVDLGQANDIAAVTVKFFDPYYAPTYFIGISDNGTNWNLIKEVTSNGGDDTTVLTARARYVGLYLTKGAKKAYGIKEFEVLSMVLPPTPTPTITPTPTATPSITPTPTTGIAPWQAGVDYEVGQLVTYNGKTWICVVTHTSNSAWTPGAPGIYLWEEAYAY